ncbi:ABC transporter ATP-binding protein [Streptomyces sp. NPDC048436]|uniref:ABC transporter ATP-binding protein n=1 Tax=Streptomyces sp. NPDC048436 TaxID=3365550 RepID=UPI00370FC89A
MKPEESTPDPLLSVQDLRISFDSGPAVRGISFDVRRGEVLALVGESGAGKSVTARAVLGMAPQGATVSGSVTLHGRPGDTGTEIVGAKKAALAALRGRRVALVPQDALSALSPVHPVGDQLAAAVRSVRGLSRGQARAAAVAALEKVGIADAGRKARAYPHEFSGGMRQRAVIAMATVNAPDLVVADEPTTALDSELRGQVLDLLVERCKVAGASLLLVTHDLGVLRGHADRVLVMYAGRHVEAGPVDEVFSRPRAPYTAGLFASLPPEEPLPGRRLPAISGAPPALDALPPGCAFAPRCPLAVERCATETPEPSVPGPEVTYDRRTVSCHRWRDLPSSPADLFLKKVTVA